jgi:hypothetical protein
VDRILTRLNNCTTQGEALRSVAAPCAAHVLVDFAIPGLLGGRFAAILSGSVVIICAELTHQDSLTADSGDGFKLESMQSLHSAPAHGPDRYLYMSSIASLKFA